jgi:hypothetical protein
LSIIDVFILINPGMEIYNALIISEKYEHLFALRGRACPSKLGAKLNTDSFVANRLDSGFCIKSGMVKKLFSVAKMKTPFVELQVRVFQV